MASLILGGFKFLHCVELQSVLYVGIGGDCSKKRKHLCSAHCVQKIPSKLLNEKYVVKFSYTTVTGSDEIISRTFSHPSVVMYAIE